MVKYLFLLLFLLGCNSPDNSTPNYDVLFNDQTFECATLVNKNLNQARSCMDFRGITLENITFEEADLKGSDFTNSHLINVHFKNINLTGANFYKTKFTNVIIENSIIDHSDWVRVEVKKMTIINSQGLNSKWQDSEMGQLVINDSFFDKIQVFKSTFTDSLINASFKEGTWEEVKINNSQFSNSNFFKSKIIKSDLSSNNYYKIALLTKDNLLLEPLTFNQFRNVDFRESIIQDSFLSLGDYFNSKFQKTKIKNVNFQGSNLDQAAFMYSEIQEVNFSSIISQSLLNNNLNYWLNEGPIKILKQKTSLNFVDASFAKIKFSIFDYVEINNSTWNQASLSYTEFSNSKINQNHFYQLSVYQIYFYNNQMRSNIFDNSILGIEIYLSSLSQGFNTLEFKQCDLQFSSFNRVGWFYYEAGSNLRFGPKFEDSDLKYSLWNLADIRKADLKNSDFTQTNLQAGFLDEVRYNSETFLPFSNETALSLGMIYE